MWLEEWGGPEALPGDGAPRRAVGVHEALGAGRRGATRTRRRRPGESTGALGDRFRVEARIVVDEVKDVVRAPASALFRKGDGWAVFAVVQGRARLKPVETGLANRTHVEIRGGLKEGEAVVLHPSDRVADGARVRARS